MESRGVMSSAAMAVAVLLALALMAPGAAAQPACAQKLIPCGNYLSGTGTPPESCCGQIREAVTNELPCLCSLLNNQDLIQAFKLNITQVLAIPRRCGISTDTSICNPATNTTTGAGAPTSAPPATPGGGGNAASVARMGASGMVVLLAFWWSLVA